MIDAAALRLWLNHLLRDATIPELPGHYRGKVRENYELPDGRRVMVATDRLSPFGINLTDLPLKGRVLKQPERHQLEEPAAICQNTRYTYPPPNQRVRPRPPQ